MKKYDVIVVGCGPAGIAAAKVLEKSNLSFCIIEKSKFPRFKLCGGGLTNKSQKILKKLYIKLDTLDSFDCQKVKIVAKDISKEIELENKIIMVDRSEFDYNNFKQINPEHLFTEENITSISENTLTTNKDSYEFKYIIFADGVNGYSKKLIKSHDFAFCIECDVDEKTTETIFDFEAVKDGYCWIFPKKKKTTIGLMSSNKKTPDYLKLLCDFAKKNNFTIDKTNIKGYHIPIFSKETYKKSVIDDKYILVGDAASLVDPVTGEGIYYALVSGMYAAQSIMEVKDDKKLSEIYFEKTKNLYNSLNKRTKASKLLYSNLGNKFIKMGLNSDTIIDKLKRLFG